MTETLFRDPTAVPPDPAMFYGAAVVVTTSRTFVAGFTLDDATVTGAFATADVGSRISGDLTGGFVYSGTSIVSVVDGVSAEMSQPAGATGSATIRVSDPDAGAIGAGRIWAQKDGNSDAVGLSIRNADNTGWWPIGPDYYTSDGALLGRLLWDPSGGGLVMQFIDSDGTMLSKVELTATSLKLYFADGVDDSVVTMDAAGVAVTTFGAATFTYNGSEVAVVP